MKYSDSAEKSTEYLRLALPRMAQQDTAMHPVSYALRYQWFAGRKLTYRFGRRRASANAGKPWDRNRVAVATA